MKKALPIGMEDFSEIMEKDRYYVDKTGLIKTLLTDTGKVSLFTRPRRFGKSLNISMLQHFFEVGTDSSLFDGLSIAKEKELCDKHLGQYPVISLSLKDAVGNDFESARINLWYTVSMEAQRHYCLAESSRLSPEEKRAYYELTARTGNLEYSLNTLSTLLYRHLGKKVVILIDEYDVPLQRAELKGYYDEMVSLISVLFSRGMKTNPYMERAVITGCLRVSKESIFTGFNNVAVYSIIDKGCAEEFGFTDAEVRQMFAYYGIEQYYETAKEWYDGYLFGETRMYCPWDIINWCSRIVSFNDSEPQNFWSHSSGNDIIRRFADMADDKTREEIGTLIHGGSIRKKLRLDLTYRELGESIDNLWSVLLTTGYLTQKSRAEGGVYELTIPNREVQSLFAEQIEDWFKAKISHDREGMKVFFDAVYDGDADTMEGFLADYLESSISYYDSGKAAEKESFYHGLLLGLLRAADGYKVESNREAGHGRFDIAVSSRRKRAAFIMEIKYAGDAGSLEADAQAALDQIKEKKYDANFPAKHYDRRIHYGIAFYKKSCRVLAVQAECS